MEHRNVADAIAAGPWDRSQVHEPRADWLGLRCDLDPTIVTTATGNDARRTGNRWWVSASSRAASEPQPKPIASCSASGSAQSSAFCRSQAVVLDRTSSFEEEQRSDAASRRSDRSSSASVALPCTLERVYGWACVSPETVVQPFFGGRYGQPLVR